MRNEATSETSCETCMWPATLISRAQLLRSSTPSEDKVKITLMNNFSLPVQLILIQFEDIPVESSCFDAGDKLKRETAKISRERHGNHERRWCLKFMLKSPLAKWIISFSFYPLFSASFFPLNEKRQLSQSQICYMRTRKVQTSRLCPVAHSQDIIFSLANILRRDEFYEASFSKICRLYNCDYSQRQD